MVYFPRETISFSRSTVLSSAGFSSLFYHQYSFLCFVIASPLSLLLMSLPASADPVPALLDNKDEAPSVTQNGFSPLVCLILHFFGGRFFSSTFGISIALTAGQEGDAALWLESQEDAPSPVNIVIG